MKNNSSLGGKTSMGESAVVAGEVAHLKAKGGALRRACAMSDNARAKALRQVELAFAKDGKARGRLASMFRTLNLDF